MKISNHWDAACVNKVYALSVQNSQRVCLLNSNTENTAWVYTLCFVIIIQWILNMLSLFLARDFDAFFSTTRYLKSSKFSIAIVQLIFLPNQRHLSTLILDLYDKRNYNILWTWGRIKTMSKCSTMCLLVTTRFSNVKTNKSRPN